MLRFESFNAHMKMNGYHGYKQSILLHHARSLLSDDTDVAVYRLCQCVGKHVSVNSFLEVYVWWW